MMQAVLVIALVAGPAIGIAVSVYVLVRSVLDFSRTESGRVYIAFKALVSLVVWFLASYGMFFMFFVTVYTAGASGSPDDEERVDALSLLFLDLLYALIGCGLALWVRHKSDHS